MSISSAPASRRSHPTVPVPVTGPVLDLVERSRTGLRAACHAQGAGERFGLAHQAAVRGAAALLAAEAPAPARSRPRSVWDSVARCAPELTEWSVFLAAAGRRKLAVDRGSVEMTSREADDLVRQAEVFLDLVLGHLGLPVQASVTRCMTPVNRP